MKASSTLYTHWLLSTVIFGSIVAFSYFSRFSPIPIYYKTIASFLFGPFLVLFSLGMYQYFKKKYNTVLNQSFFLCNTLAGLSVEMMFTVQNLNGAFYNEISNQLPAEFTKDQIQIINSFINTVQRGMGMVWDIFISLGTIFLGLEFFIRNLSLKIMRAIGLIGVIVSAVALALNFYSWPQVNHEAIGLVDLGPFIGIWYLFPYSFTIYEYIKLKKDEKSNIISQHTQEKKN